MKNQTIFKRYEIKYMLTKEQKDIIKSAMQDYMCEDEYGKNTICNIYYDTADSLLVRRSMEKPVYKEKFRIRSYGVVDHDGTVFAELKKKYRSVVYKRRITMKEEEAMNYMAGEFSPYKDSQISHEIDYFLSIYRGIAPKVFLSYEREAFYGRNDDDFRITFDENILWRDYDLSLCAGIYGEPILPDNMALMEIKTANAIPLWMTKLLSENRLFKTSFSKYGTAYMQALQLAKGA